MWVTPAESISHDLARRAFLGVSPNLLVLEKLSHTPEGLVDLHWPRRVTCLRRRDGHMSATCLGKAIYVFIFFQFHTGVCDITSRDSRAPKVDIIGLL